MWRPFSLPTCSLSLVLAIMLAGPVRGDDVEPGTEGVESSVDARGSTEKGADSEIGSWDQARVTMLASELADVLREAYAQTEDAPPQQTVLQQRKRDAARGVVRRARDLSEDYALKMREGLSRVASEPRFRVVDEAVTHIWETADDAVAQESVQPRIERLQRILDELRARYDTP